MRNVMNFPGRSFPISWLVAIAGLFIVTRLPFINHTLSIDEAWNLVALQSLATGDTIFMERYWLHPPLYMWLGLLLSPTAPGIEQRMSLLSLALNCGALLLFIRMISSLFGRQTALYTGIAYVMLPGALFYDTWIKRDPVVTLFGVLAVSNFLCRKYWLAGISLGLGLLGKGTAVFYWNAVFLLAVVLRPVKYNWRKLIVMFGTATLISFWWYLRVSKSSVHYFDSLTGESGLGEGFYLAWWYYFIKLTDDLGFAGIVLMLVGLLSYCPKGNLRPLLTKIKRTRYLPIYLLLPSYIIMSLSAVKPPWLNTVLLLPLALLVGLGWSTVINFLIMVLAKITGEKKIQFKTFFAGFLLLIILGIPLLNFDFDNYMRRVMPDQISVMEQSLELATIVNEKVRDNERLLILPMLYRTIAAKYPDPYFYWHLETSPHILRNRNIDLSYPAFKNLIISKKVHWVLMSPSIGSSQEKLVWGLSKDIPLSQRQGGGTSFGGGLYWVEPLWKNIK
jgi:4-amino-4-deoxy-L-arabinose transferase-like glycosyltransferase